MKRRNQVSSQVRAKAISHVQVYLAFAGFIVSLLILTLTLSRNLHAQEPQVVEEVPDVEVVGTAPEQEISGEKLPDETTEEIAKGVTDDEGAVEEKAAQQQDLPARLHQAWQLAFEALGRGDLTEANVKFLELNGLKVEGGFESLDAISLELIARARSEYEARNVETAAFLVKKALQLSPESPDVLLSSLYVGSKTNIADGTNQITNFLSLLVSYPAKFLEKVRFAIYPVLWAVTLGLLAAMIFSFIAGVHPLLRSVSKRLPISLRGILTPLLALALLIIPLWFGPLWGLFAWSLLICVFLPNRKQLSLIAGLTLVLWGVGIDFNEKLSFWFADSGIQALIRTSSGAFHDTDRRTLEDLVERRSNDAVAHYTLGQLYRRYGQLDSAVAAFEKAEKGLPTDGRVEAQRGMIAFLREDYNEANKQFEAAEAAGLSSAQFFVNFSKVKFAMLDTEASRDLVKRAMEQNTSVTKKLQEREDELGLRNANALAEIYLPFSSMLHSALDPMPGYEQGVRTVTGAMMSGLGSTGILISGIVLIVLFFVFGKRESSGRLPSYYGGYESSSVVLGLIRIVPGGAWMLAGRPVQCTALLAILVLFVMPLLGWPASTASLVDLFPHWAKLYTWGVLAFVLFILFLGTMLQEER